MTFTKYVVFIIFSIIVQILSKERNFTNRNRPNFIFILTDDQDVELGGLIPLQKTKRMLSDKGAIFKNMFVTTPLCCPSRASILTGLYTHNHGIVNNSISGNCSSKLWQSTFEKATFITYLKKENYTTFYAGKYLNQYGFKASGGVSHIPPGWDNWIGLVGNSKYYNYTLSVNGKPESHGDDSSDYLTTVMTTKALKFLQSYKLPQGPFFMMLAPPSPHKPYIPEDKYKKRFNDKHAPRTPNFNIHAQKDKHWLIRQPPNPLPGKVIKYIDNIFKERWRTLLTVDDMVEKLINVLKEMNILNNTYIIFSSDNGFHLGQFSLPEDKRQLYEFDIRVPLIVRGPGIKSKLELMEPVLNIDFAPTFMDLAGIKIPNDMDGTSFANLLYKKPKSWRNQFFVEHKGESAKEINGCPQYLNSGVSTCEVDCICEDSWNNTYSCLRILSLQENAICCIFKDNKDFIESYNLTADPYQLKNLGGKFCSKYQSVNKYLQHILNLIS
ncbi:N-acetylglucosamine-6-sulfatase-like isoform X1 [Centruroides sculpturatus]|uniref:N-acetylglucosamine-6-sulfatase-like isoform X1 n=2 Tax=Centruroides sculpturatus TaxID=218467 RepID=UPI000C6EC1E3|nr:N-acetylglucosamine-6-sulfatase-like isoform X1 [Centruroides sculpturatus]